MKVKQILLLVGLLCIVDIYGQSVSSRINNIKRDPRYIYEDATAKTEEEAYKIAYEGLIVRIQEYVNAKKKFKNADNIVINNINKSCEQINMSRGEMSRVFLYVRVNDIDPAQNLEVIAKETVDAIDNVDKTIGKNQEPQNDNNQPIVSIDQLEKVWQREVVNRIIEAESIIGAQAHLSRMKAEFKINKYGAMNSCNDIANSWLVIFDNDNNIVALLGPEKDNFRPDYMSKTYKSLNDFSGLNAVWFIFA